MCEGERVTTDHTVLSNPSFLELGLEDMDDLHHQQQQQPIPPPPLASFPWEPPPQVPFLLSSIPNSNSSFEINKKRSEGRRRQAESPRRNLKRRSSAPRWSSSPQESQPTRSSGEWNPTPSI